MAIYFSSKIQKQKLLLKVLLITYSKLTVLWHLKNLQQFILLQAWIETIKKASTTPAIHFQYWIFKVDFLLQAQC